MHRASDETAPSGCKPHRREYQCQDDSLAFSIQKVQERHEQALCQRQRQPEKRRKHFTLKSVITRSETNRPRTADLQRTP